MADLSSRETDSARLHDGKKASPVPTLRAVPRAKRSTVPRERSWPRQSPATRQVKPSPKHWWMS